VQWWSTLHQGASINLTTAPSMAHIMVTAMLLMVAAFWLYSAAVALARVRGIIAAREPGAIQKNAGQMGGGQPGASASSARTEAP